MNNPCKDCTDRHQRCHAECEKYAAWSAEHEKRRAENLKHSETTYFIMNSKPRRK